MAIATPTNLTKGRNTSDLTTYNSFSASITPTIGSDGIVVALVSWQNASGAARSLSSLSGCGLTWVIQAQVENPAATRWGVALVTGIGTPTSGQLTAVFSAGINDLQWTIDEYASGVDTATNHGIVQSNTATGTTSPASVSLSAFGNATDNVAHGGIVHRVNEDISPGSGFTEVTTDNSGTTPDFHQLSEYQVGEDTTVDFTFATTHTWAAAALEIKAVVSGGPGPETFHRNAQLPYNLAQTQSQADRLWPEVLDATQMALPARQLWRDEYQPRYNLTQKIVQRLYPKPVRRLRLPKLQRSGRFIIDTDTNQRVALRGVTVYAVQPYDGVGDPNVDGFAAWFADTSHLMLFIAEMQAKCINCVRLPLRNDTTQTYKNRIYNLAQTLADYGIYTIFCPFDIGADSFAFGSAWPTASVSNDTATACGNYVRARWEEMGKPDYVMFETVNEPQQDVGTPADVTAYISGNQAFYTAATSSGYTGIIFTDGLNFSWEPPAAGDITTLLGSYSNNVFCSHRYATPDGSSQPVFATTDPESNWRPKWPDRSRSEGFAFVVGEWGIYNGGFGTGGSDDWLNNQNGWGKAMTLAMRDAYQRGDMAGAIAWIWAWDDADDGVHLGHYGNSLVDDYISIQGSSTWTINTWGDIVYSIMREMCSDFPPLPLPQSEFPRLYSQTVNPYRRTLNSTVMDFTPAATTQLFTNPQLLFRDARIQQANVQRLELTPDVLDALQPPIPFQAVAEKRPYSLQQFFVYTPRLWPESEDALQTPLYPNPLGFNEHQYSQSVKTYILRLWPEILNGAVITPDTPLFPFPTTHTYDQHQFSYQLPFPTNLFVGDIPLLLIKQLSIPPYRIAIYADQHKRIPTQVEAPEPAPLRLLQYRSRRPWHGLDQRAWRRWVPTILTVPPITPVPSLDQDALYAIVQSPSGFRVILVSPTSYSADLASPTGYRAQTNKINRG